MSIVGSSRAISRIIPDLLFTGFLFLCGPFRQAHHVGMMNQQHSSEVPSNGGVEPSLPGFYPAVDPLPGSGGRRPGEPSLRDVALLCLTVGRLLLESGANGRVVHEAIATVATGLGCDGTEAFCQHAAIIVVLTRRGESHTRMGKVGEHGVNLRRCENIQEAVRRIGLGEFSCEEAQRMVSKIPSNTRHYPLWFVCLATGLACSAFGRLFKSDWLAFLPTLVGTAAGQYVRHVMFHARRNIFLIWGVVSFVSAMIAGVGALWLHCDHIPLAMTAAVLLLVPGIPILNAQIDAIEGRPSLASARGLCITFMLLFMALSLAAAQVLLLGKGYQMAATPPDDPFWFRIAHQMVFGGLAAVGFGVLFNTPPRLLGLCFASGAFALAVRTYGQSQEWGLPLSTFVAALALATVDRTWQKAQTPQGSILAVVGCIPMVPGSLAAKGLMGLFGLIWAHPDTTALAPLVVTVENLIVVTFTLVAIGVGLIIPTLVYPTPDIEE